MSFNSENLFNRYEPILVDIFKTLWHQANHIFVMDSHYQFLSFLTVDILAKVITFVEKEKTIFFLYTWINVRICNLMSNSYCCIDFLLFKIEVHFLANSFVRWVFNHFQYLENDFSGVGLILANNTRKPLLHMRKYKLLRC